MIAISARMTASEFMRLPEDGSRHELVKGELIIMPPAKKKHGRLEMKMIKLLMAFIGERDVGEITTGDTGFLIARNPDTIRSPDVGFIQSKRVAESTDDDGYWELAPDLAVEVLSPSDSAGDVQEKIDEWLESGTRLVWVVNPAKKTVHVHVSKRAVVRLRIGETLEGEDVLPGLKIAVAEIFA